MLTIYSEVVKFDDGLVTPTAQNELATPARYILQNVTH